MKKIAAIFKNKEIVDRIFFTVVVLFIWRIGTAITVPGVTISDFSFSDNDAFGLMNMLGGGALQSFSIFALGVSPYITSSIIVQLLSTDVLPALTELSKQGQAGRRKIDMTTRYLTLLLGAVQAYGIIVTMENSSYITLAHSGFWGYAYIITIMLAGTMVTMWLGDQISVKGIGNGISMIIFAGIVVSLPIQFSNAFTVWLGSKLNVGLPVAEVLTGLFQFLVYVLVFLIIIIFITFIENSQRRIPVQNAGKGGRTAKYAQASFLPIKVNSSGVIPVIFASSLMMAPSIIVSFISGADPNANWLNIFSSSKMTVMPWFNNETWNMPWGLLIYILLILGFSFLYAQMQINPEKLAENFQKNGSYIPGVRPGNETERYVRKVVNRVTAIGAIALAAIAALPIILTLTGAVPDQSLALGGTGMIIVVGVAQEIGNQIDGLLAGKSFEEIKGSAGGLG